MMSYRIGIDIGTTSTKAVLYGENMEKIASSNVGYRTYHDQPGYAEQEPMEILFAFKEAVIDILKDMGDKRKNVSLISFSSAMHSLILVDEEGTPLTRSLIWSDNRSVLETEKFRMMEDWLNHYKNTGTPIHSMTPFFKMKWYRDHTVLLEKTYKAIGIKEFIIHHLTGKYVVDFSVASATGMFNIHQLKWDEFALAYLGISEEMLSLPVDVTTRLKLVQKDFLNETGLPASLDLMIGASDGCLANLGSGAMRKGEATITIGTSGAVRMTVDQPKLDEQGKTFCYYLNKNSWVVGGAVNNGGNILNWFDGVFYEESGQVYEKLDVSIAKIPVGCDGLLFIPYLNGERSPHWDGRLTASYFGMRAYHEKAHFVRATIEGILFNLKEVLMRLETVGGKSVKLTASGGFLKSEAWSRLLSEIFEMEIRTKDSEDSSCLGAILLDESSGKRTADDCESVILTYDPVVSERYQSYFKKYLWYSERIKGLQEEGRGIFPY